MLTVSWPWTYDMINPTKANDIINKSF